MTIPSQDLDSTLISWLSGIIDGEGSFALYKMKNRVSTIVAGLTIVNTDLGILNKVVNTYKMLGINSHIISKVKSKPNYKNCYQVIIRKREDLKKILPEIITHMSSSKKQKAIEILEFVRNNPRHYGNQYTASKSGVTTE